MEKPAINYAVKLLRYFFQRQGVDDEKCRIESSFSRLPFRPAYRFLEEIDSVNGVSSLGKEQSNFTGSTASIENGTLYLIGYFNEGFLRTANVPRGFTLVSLLIKNEIMESRSMLRR